MLVIVCTLRPVALLLDAVFEAAGVDNRRGVPVSEVVTSPVFDEFFRSIAIWMEGDRGIDQELDTEIHRYDLIDKTKVKKPLQHQEL